MYKLKLFLWPVALLLAFMALACAPADDDDAPSSGPSGPSSKPTIRNIPDDKSPKLPKAEQAEQQSPEAAITGASYDVGTALLTVQGTLT